MFPAGPAMKQMPAAIVAFVILWFVLACMAGQRKTESAKKGSQPGGEVTFNRDIAPIVFRYCSPCHRSGEAAPFSLLTYEDTVKFARQIAYITEKRLMPPWLPAVGELKLQGEMRLTDAQIDLIKRWTEAGSPRGNPADLPPAPVFAQEWQLGKPDVILRARKTYTLPAAGTDNYWNFIFPTQLSGTHWVKAVEIRPGEKRVVHHANVLVDRLHSSRRQEKHAGDGFAGMELRIESETFDPDSHLFFWKPGSIPREEPEGMALRLDPGDDFVLNTHLQPSGKAEEIEPSIGLYFTNQPATKFPILLELQNDKALDIPAGANDFVVTDDFSLTADVDLLAIYPHAHYLGKELRATATRPDGTTQTLILIPRWDLNWQAVFYYAEPVYLAKGTMISMRYTYDNREANIANPFHPPQRVMGGNRTTDEMAHLWLQVLPRGTTEEREAARRSLQEAVARHDIARDAGDFAAQYNLGAMLQARGEAREALEHYRAAVSIRPQDAIANNALGGALLALGDASAAVGPLRAAAQTQPDYFPAHYNLGNALASLEQFQEAAEEFKAAVRLRPDDSMAQANLGGALAESGELEEAQRHLEKAVELDPRNAVAQGNLAEVKRQRAAGQNR
jgi:tetratricopeptide (TPR) repeat protein